MSLAGRVLGLASAALCVAALAACGGPSGDDRTPASSATTTGLAQDDVVAADMVLGADDAPVTVIEYASVTCPICAIFHLQIFPRLKADYIDTGKVKFVFRELPAHNPPLSYAGSMVARCASEKGGTSAYFAVVDQLFQTQKIWAEGDNPRGELQKVAAATGIDQAAFEACVSRQDLIDFISTEASEARDRYQVTGTPSFIVNGERARFSTADAMSKAIDEALENAEK